MDPPAPVVSNASPLIALERIGHLDLLKVLLGGVIVPPQVAREVFGDDSPPDWIRVTKPETTVPEAATLGAGEREAIALAEELEAVFDMIAEEYRDKGSTLPPDTTEVVHA